MSITEWEFINKRWRAYVNKARPKRRALCIPTSNWNQLGSTRLAANDSRPETSDCSVAPKELRPYSFWNPANLCLELPFQRASNTDFLPIDSGSLRSELRQASCGESPRLVGALLINCHEQGVPRTVRSNLGVLHWTGICFA
jgi:hypothetical protein